MAAPHMRPRPAQVPQQVSVGASGVLQGVTQDGEAAFLRLRDAATAFDHRLRDGLTDTDLDGLAALLGRLAGNVAGEPGTAAPWPD